jgi:hypothetical protein
MNLLNWKNRASVAWTADSTYEIERLEVVTGVFWFCVGRLATRRGQTSGGRGRWREPRFIAEADSGRREQDDLRQGYAPRAHARVSQLLPAAFAAFTKINDLQARPSQKTPRPSRFF